MSGHGDENPDDEGREAIRGYTNSLSGRADGCGGGDDDRSQLAARYGRQFWQSQRISVHQEPARFFDAQVSFIEGISNKSRRLRHQRDSDDTGASADQVFYHPA